MEKARVSIIGFVLALLAGLLLGMLMQPLFFAPADGSLDLPPLESGEIEAPTGEPVASQDLVPDSVHELLSEAALERREVMGTRKVDPDLGILLYGTLRDGEGKLVELAYLGLSSVEMSGSGISAQVKKGAYSVHGLQPGSWKVRIRGEGLTTTETVLEIPEEPLVRRDLSATRAYLLTVRVRTPEGQAFTTALVEAQKASFSHRALSAVATRKPLESAPMTDLRALDRFGVGRWQGVSFSRRRKDISDDPDVIGLIEIGTAPPVYVSLMQKHHVLASKLITPGESEVTFELAIDELLAKLANVRLRVVEQATGQPIANARVSISDRQSGGGGQPSDESGTVVIPNQATGLMELDIWGQGYEYYHTKLRLMPGEVDLGNIELWPSHTVQGVVVDANGQPREANITCSNLDRRTFPQPLVTGRAYSSNSKGVFKLEGLGGGAYLIQARVRGEAVATSIVHPELLGETELRLELQVTQNVYLDNSQTATSRILMALIRDSEGRLVYGNYLRSPARFKAELSAGEYVFEIFEGLHSIQSGSLTLSPGSPAEIVIAG